MGVSRGAMRGVVLITTGMIDATGGSRLSRDVCRLLTPRAGAAIHKIPTLATLATANAAHTTSDLGSGVRAFALFGPAPLLGTPSLKTLGKAAFPAI
jgi:hypothetical protein